MQSFPPYHEFVYAQQAGGDDTNYKLLDKVLRQVREMLRMDVVFVSEFGHGQRTFRYVDSAFDNPPIAVGGGGPLEESYCQRVIDGRLPRAIPDAMALPAARALPATEAVGVRAHLSVPIVLRTGRVFGTLCCFSQTGPAPLGDEDTDALLAIANFIASGIDKNGLFRTPDWPESAPPAVH